MNESPSQSSAQIPVPPEDWEQTPTSVKTWVGELLKEIERVQKQLKGIEDRVETLEEKTAQTSENSSQPPSQDGFKKKKKESAKVSVVVGVSKAMRGKGEDSTP